MVVGVVMISGDAVALKTQTDALSDANEAGYVWQTQVPLLRACMQRNSLSCTLLQTTTPSVHTLRNVQLILAGPTTCKSVPGTHH
jgi:hypothetical protein